MTRWMIRILLLALVIGAYVFMRTQSAADMKMPAQTQSAQSDSLVIVWTSGDRDVALKMVFMYTFNAKKYEWWQGITLIVWGPSAKLLSEDPELQTKLKEIMNTGVVVKACKGCSDQYGVSDSLSAMGIDVKYIGKELTNYIKSSNHVLTF